MVVGYALLGGMAEDVTVLGAGGEEERVASSVETAVSGGLGRRGEEERGGRDSSVEEEGGEFSEPSCLFSEESGMRASDSELVITGGDGR